MLGVIGKSRDRYTHRLKLVPIKSITTENTDMREPNRSILTNLVLSNKEKQRM
jgi:hypothetical protein